MKLIEEFKSFILKGDVVSLSTGVIIGASFTTIVTAFTKGVVEPLLALAGGGPTPKWTIPLVERMVDVKEKGPDGAEVVKSVNKLIELDIGGIVGALVQFMITAAVIFFVIIKPYNILMARVKKAEAAPAPAGPSEEVKILTEIRDALKK
jgi:large conductance mechanosensitive channel